MLYVDEDTLAISLTRGDTARLTVPIEDELTEEEYVFAANDTLKLTVKKNPKLEEFLFQKVVKGTNVFHIEPSDTKKVPFGKYVYDVELTTASGDVYTVIGYDPESGAKTFEILAEVT